MRSTPQNELLGPLLRGVSRSFYLTLKILPLPIRPQVSVAYLLARASDTIADSRAVPAADRLRLLRQIQQDDLQGIPLLGASHASAAELDLLRRLPECLVLRDSFLPGDQMLIKEVHRTIIDGQIFDLERFPGESEAELVSLADSSELDRYTYLVAGCVGVFWTRICMAHLAELRKSVPWKDGGMEELGVRLGKGLQLINILRDLPRDLRQGRCYLPLPGADRLLDPSRFDEIRDVYEHWLETALGHLEAGWDYTMQIPPSLPRLRLACTWPIWIGLRTIGLLRRANPLDPGQRIKVSRAAIYRLVARSWLGRTNDRALARRYRVLLREARVSG